MADEKFPESYKDASYASLDAATEQKLELPPGLLASVRLNGERSNHSQTNDEKTFSAYQFTPSTRRAILDKYGLDVTLSPQNASEGAGLLLQESLKRNGDDPAQAVGEYIGGTDRANWGKTTKAYINRVLTGLQAIKANTMGDEFAKWMAANPATPAAQPAPAPGTQTAPASAAAPAASPLDAAFAQHVATQAKSGPDAIPVEPGANTVPTPEAPTNLPEKLLGTGEAALSTLTGLTGGAVGMVGGAGKGLVDAVQSGNFGKPEGVQQVEQAAAAGANALTYAPRTPSGQAQTEAVGNVMQQAIPLAPVLPGIPMAAKPAMSVARGAVQDAQAAKAAMLQAVKEKVLAAAGRRAEAANDPTAQPTPGTMGSVGAAGTDVATMRRANAQQLPVPIDLTKGQAERTFEQQRFEGEMAKDPVRGQALRDRAAEQHAQVWKNFDSWLDETGEQKVTLGEKGDAVKGALMERAQADKNRIRAAYKEAEKAGELEQPVTLQGAVDYLNENAPDAAVAKVLDAARARAVRLGIAAEGEGGDLIAQPVPLKTAELFRRAVSNATDYEPTNVLHSSRIKGLVDDATEGMGGDLYRSARALRSRYAQNYENIGLVYDLMNNKRGMSDAKVAAENVFQRSILNSSMADVKQLRRILQTGGERGQQAWRELQGATLRHIREEAARNITRNERGQEMVSAKGLDSAVTGLDKSGKLDFIFGKKGAEQLRSLNDLAKDLFTAPPGAINSSNTASVILAALDIATSGIAGMPAPIFSGLRILTTHVKDRQIQKRINEALGIKPQPKVKAPRSAIPPINPAFRPPENRTVH